MFAGRYDNKRNYLGSFVIRSDSPYKTVDDLGKILSQRTAVLLASASWITISQNSWKKYCA
jgi:hypothetical protein